MRYSGAFRKPENAGKTYYKGFYLLHADFWLGLFFDPEDGGDMFLRNAGWLSIG
jgi:hypothetical protein